MKAQYLTEIELPIWADPQGDLMLEKSRDDCHVYFDCWEDNKPTYANYIGKIIFENAWAVKSLDIEYYDIFPIEDWKYKSSICVVENSCWLDEMIQVRTRHYNNWTKWKDKNYRHFHCKGHDNYFDIIAENYKVEKVLKKDVEHYEKLWR
ncbi:hypothetical protein [Pedobacter frigiditerrae]|uniref:hypothetical protein n=1 Tax=Pedobacter frigiditerrae TaxID=2530452 RepID=UPI00292FBC30|nr:hypothetical protein [Pedobacter frigiditerrae]